MHELFPDAPLCNEGIALRLRGTLDVAALQRALQAIVERHESLRASFHQSTAGVMVEIAETAAVPFEQINLEAADADSRPRLLEGIARTVTAGRFDLSAPPLLRATLVREAADCHVLLVAFHHIVADGTSFLKLFPQELAQLYLAGEQTPIALPPVTSYQDFVSASMGEGQRARVADDLIYWQEALAGAPAFLPLPTDRPYPARPSGQGVRLEQRLPAGGRQRVQQLAAELQVRPFDVTAAAFAALLARYGDAEEVVLGTPIANRAPAFKRTIGCFINALVLRARLREDTRFRDLIGELGRTRREARRHDHVPFGELIDHLHLGGARDAARNPVYQVMFNYLDFSLDDLAIPGLQVEGWRASAGTSMLDLSLDVTEESDGGYLLCLEANTDVFDLNHAWRLLDHYVGLLDAGLSDPAAVIWDLPFIPASEEASIAAAARGPSLGTGEPEAARPFHQLVSRQAQRSGDRIAVRSEQRALSYRQLVAAFEAVAEGLRRQGVTPGELVMVGSGDDPCDTLTLILGVMAAGAAYVPLDPASPPARQQAVQRDCGARWLLMGSGFDARWRSPGLRVLPFDSGDPGWRGLASATPLTPAMPSGSPASPPSPLDLPAYLMYTSGSTGTPKGVLISQRNLLHQCRARLQRYDDPPGILLGTYSFAFDSSLAGICHALTTGGTLRFAGERLRRDPLAIGQVIADEAITHLDMVPSAYAAVLAEATADRLRSLRGVICGGEALPGEVAERHFQLAPQARLFNEYGPTEATVFATVHELRAGEHGRPSIGRPVGNTSCWILDPRGRLVPLGHPGELCIGGGGVAQGYHGRPADTAQRFVVRPLEGGVERRLYRTGDQARLRPDGTLDLVGRLDDQVQLRGHRVELGEVEAVLRQVPGVKDAAVVLRTDPGSLPQLVGYFVAAETAAASAASIRKQLSARLPSYMVPAVLVPVPVLRRTARGKLDRESLPRPQTGAAGPVHEEPGTATEVRLAGLWQRLLGKTRIGRADDFFALGGHSLLAVKLVDAIEREMGAKLRLADIFQSPTLEGMASALGLDGHDEPAPRWRCLEVIHGEGRGLPLFFLGSTAQARSIATHLGDERPVYGLNIFGLHETGQEPPRLEIDELARVYLEEIRAVHPHGPYCLAGYCEDAKVAMEVARQLEAGGEKVGTLVLIDAVWFLRHHRPEPDERFGRARKLARNVQRFGLDFVRHRLQRRRRYAREDLRLVLCEIETAVRRLLGAEAPLQLEHRVLITRYYEALGRYQVPDYRGVIHLYVAEEWGLAPGERLPGDVPVQAIAGYHDQILEGQGLLDLANHMRQALAQADAAARRSTSTSRSTGRLTRVG